MSDPDKYASRRGPRANAESTGPPPREKLDRWAHERHAQRLEQERLARLGGEYERVIGAKAIAVERHPCAGELALLVRAFGDAFRFRCSCGAELEVTGKEATARGTKP